MPAITAVFSRRFIRDTRVAKVVGRGAIASHCGVVVGGHVIEALARVPGPLFPALNGKVVRTPLDEWHARYPWTATRRYPVLDQAAGEAFALAQEGKRYDVDWFIGVHWRSSWDDPEKWGCSELLAATLSAAGSPRFYQDKRYVSPMDCWLAA